MAINDAQTSGNTTWSSNKIDSAINTKVNKSDIANNVTTTTAGKVLDARQGKALQDSKADNSVIAPVESGTTASQAYAAGAHFIKDGAFCTAKTAIAQGETFTLNTNYTAGDVAGNLQDSIAVITGTTGAGISLAYPSGFTMNNSVIIGLQFKNPSESLWRTMGVVNENLACVISAITGPSEILVIPRNSIAENSPFKVTLYKYQ